MSFEQETNDTLVFGASIVKKNSDESILDFCHCLAKKNELTVVAKINKFYKPLNIFKYIFK